jgi:AcrR family transcriptional regulator
VAARAGLSRHDVIAAAVAMLDEGAAPDDVSLGALARRLGIRPQSLYAHVDGSEGLAREIALVGLDALAVTVRDASIGVTGRDAVAAIVRAHLEMARARPLLYEAALHPPGSHASLLDAQREAVAPLHRVLDRLGLESGAQVHFTRLLLSSVYGFVVLRRSGRFTLSEATDETEAHLVEMLLRSLPVVTT